MISKRYYSYIRKKSKKEKKPIVIVFGTDSHIKAPVDGKPDAEGAVGGTRFYYTAGQKMQKFVDDVNQIKPDLVFFGGDMIEELGEGSEQLFMEKWNQIDPNIRKELTIGNHDLAWQPELANTYIADVFGYGERQIIAGSKFNQSFTLSNGDNSVKIISVDTNINENGEHEVVTAQYLKEPVRNWVKSELMTSEQENVIILSHGGMEDDKFHFNEADAIAFKEMIDDVLSERPTLKIYSFFGHNHNPNMGIRHRYDNPIISYSIPPIVDFDIGKYVVITFSEKDGISLELRELPYS